MSIKTTQRDVEISVPDCPLRSHAKKLRKLAKTAPHIPVIERALLHAETMIEAGAAIYAYKWRYGVFPDISSIQHRSHVRAGYVLAVEKYRSSDEKIGKLRLSTDMYEATNIQRQLTTRATGANGGYIDGLSDKARKEAAELRKAEGRGKPIIGFEKPKRREHHTFIDCRKFYGEKV